MIGSMSETVNLLDRTVKLDFGDFPFKPGMLSLPFWGIRSQGMTLAKRIKIAREALGWSQGELARRLGIQRPAVSMWESGKSVPRLPMIPELSRTLNVDEAWLVTGTGHNKGMSESSIVEKNQPTSAGNNYPDELRVDDARSLPFSSKTDLPVFAGAEGGCGDLIIHPEPVDYIRRPNDLEHIKDAFGIVVTGSSMVPAYKPGEIAMVNPRQAPAPGDDCILIATDEHGQRRAVVKEFVQGTATTWVVRQYFPKEETVDMPRSEWQVAHKVVGKLNR